MMAPSEKRRESEGLMPSLPNKTVITRNKTSATFTAEDVPTNGTNGDDDYDDDPEMILKEGERKVNLNSHYGNLIGFLQTLSLTLNAAMMIYAHVGLSGVVYSSQDPDILSSVGGVPSSSSTNNNPSPTPAPTLGGNLTGTGGNGTNTGATPPVLDGDCDYLTDVPIWIARGGFENRKFDSNFCAREYNENGCLLDGGCLQECFQGEFGYTPACSACFANINVCVSQSSCLMQCAGDSLGDTCQDCLRDTPCDAQFYECSGLPEDIDAFLAEQQGQVEPEEQRTGACTEDDEQSWFDLGGLDGRGDLASFCALEYNDNGCLINEACIQECVQESAGFSAGCSVCFSDISPCIVAAGCLGFCAVDSTSDSCLNCLAASTCDTEFFECTGLSEDLTDVDDGTNSTTDATKAPSASDDGGGNDDPTTVTDFSNVELGECLFEGLEEVETWYVVYNLTFAGSIQDAWTSEVYGLAIMIVVFSGIWPYAKNIALVLIWFVPMTDQRRSKWLLWLSRLSKYTLVDVYAVIMVLVGVQLDLNIGGITAIIRAEARFAIIAFLLATVWEFIQIEWMKVQHHKFIDYHKRLQYEHDHDGNGNGNDEEEANDEMLTKTNGHSNGHANAAAIETPETNGDATPDTLADGSNDENGSSCNKGEEEQQKERQQGNNINVTHLYITLSMMLLTIVLFTTGAALELVRIANFYLGTSDGCVAAYNLANAANPLVNEVAFQNNNHTGQHWTLYIFYIVFALALPISVHLLQITFFYLLTTNTPSITSNKQLYQIGDLAGILWGMASVEVLLLGLFAVEYKFEKFIKSLAGEQGAQFIDVQSTLGPGFIILVIYSIVAGMLQYYVRVWFMEKLEKEDEFVEVVEEENMNGEVKAVEETSKQ